VDLTIKLHAELRKAFGSKDVRISLEREDATLKEAIDMLFSIDPAGEHAARIIVSGSKPHPSISSGDAVNPAVIILINDADYRLLGGIDAPLHDGDSITLLPTIHGG
jgi:molybdopterin synthase sulfur carrier subunit